MVKDFEDLLAGIPLSVLDSYAARARRAVQAPPYEVVNACKVCGKEFNTVDLRKHNAGVRTGNPCYVPREKIQDPKYRPRKKK